MSEVSPEAARLIAAVSLRDLAYNRLSATRMDEPRPPEDCGMEVGVSVAKRDPSGHDETREFRIALTLDIKGPLFTAQVTPLAEYSVPASHKDLLTDRVITEFVNEVAVQTMAPYAREALADLLRRLGMTFPPIPLWKKGDFQFPLPEEGTENPESL